MSLRRRPVRRQRVRPVPACLPTVLRRARTLPIRSLRHPLLQGWFNETLPGAPIQRIALLRLDGDL